MKIGLFGGCFNPPSKIHIDIAKRILEENNLDKVIFVPVGDSYNKNELSESKHRYNMLKLAIGDNKNLEVDDIELNIKKKMYAIDVFELLEGKYKEYEMHFIMGSDNFEKMPKWKDYDKLKKYKYIVVERNKEDISSSRIRELIKENKNITRYLDEKVYKYIIKSSLYK